MGQFFQQYHKGVIEVLVVSLREAELLQKEIRIVFFSTNYYTTNPIPLYTCQICQVLQNTSLLVSSCT